MHAVGGNPLSYAVGTAWDCSFWNTLGQGAMSEMSDISPLEENVILCSFSSAKNVARLAPRCSTFFDARYRHSCLSLPLGGNFHVCTLCANMADQIRWGAIVAVF